MLDLIQIYNDWLKVKNEMHRKKRYEGYQSWFHGSASGMCMRKHYFQHIAGVKPKPVNENTLRLFRMGDLVHEDVQNSIRDYAETSGASIFIEREIRIPEVNVRGFLDVIIAEDKTLYDIKTCNSWKWKQLFGRAPDPNPAINYLLQLGTYGWWYEMECGEKLDKLALLYYKKDNSDMRVKHIPVSYIDRAKEYWRDVKKRFKKGNPPIELGVAPVYQWECNIKYCNFYEVCGGGLKGKGDEL